MSTPPTPPILPDWLAARPLVGGYPSISDPRPYQYDEAGYDAYYHNPPKFEPGRGLVALLAAAGADTSRPALEVGCGTGLLSLGLVERSPYPLTILTDPSPAFLTITRNKITAQGVSLDRAALVVMLGEHVDRLPPASLSLIALRSTLHHIADVDAFLAAAARALVPGGVIAFEEPCMEGYVLMGALAGLLPDLARVDGVELSPEHAALAKLFADTMAFYARRDLDKSAAEDKHLFRVDEIMAIGGRVGVTFHFHANRSFDTFAPATITTEPQRPPPTFTEFFREYAKFCMSWPDDLMAIFDRVMPPRLGSIEAACQGASGPYRQGVWVGAKR